MQAASTDVPVDAPGFGYRKTLLMDSFWIDEVHY